MRAIVIYESMFGNTETIARAIAEGLGRSFDVDVVNVDDAPKAPGVDVDLVVVGGPTHAFGLSRKATRDDAAGRIPGDIVSRYSGLREWLATTSPARADAEAAAFDTRIAKIAWTPGSAARAASNRLRRLGYRLAAKPMDFRVDGMLGPLGSGEVDRARAWGVTLGEECTARRSQPA